MLQARGQETLKIPGEDAIINWPNAKETIIDQRDAFMARTLWAAATGEPPKCVYSCNVYLSLALSGFRVRQLYGIKKTRF